MAYTAFITTLDNFQKDPKSDRLYTATCLSEGVIVGENMSQGQRVVYFPSDGCLCDYDFAIAFNLLRKDKDGNAAGGYLDYPSMHIKALKLRGLRSEGIVVGLDQFAAYYKLTEADFQDGEAIDSIGDTKICQKYIPRKKRGAAGTPGSSKKGKKKNGLIFPEFDMHIDTGQLAYNRSAFREGDLINISLKLHGTSQRSMRTYAEHPMGFWRKILDKIIRCGPKTTKVFALGTRRTVLMGSLTNSGFYGDDSFRQKHHNKLKQYIQEGMEIFYEVVGWQGPETLIMPVCDNKKLNDKAFIKKYGNTTMFTYGCEQGQSEMYVYRITVNNGEKEYTPKEIENWCSVAGVNHVPYLEDFTFTTWKDLMEKVNRYVDGPDLIDPTHIREGVVVRILNRRKFSAYKMKNMSFKILEGIVKSDALAPDIEEAQEDYNV